MKIKPLTRSQKSNKKSKLNPLVKISMNKRIDIRRIEGGKNLCILQETNLKPRVLSLILLDSQIKKNMKNLKNRIHFQFSPSQNLKKEF